MDLHVFTPFYKAVARDTELLDAAYFQHEPATIHTNVLGSCTFTRWALDTGLWLFPKL